MRDDTKHDIIRQHEQRARAFTRMYIYDRLPREYRDVFKERAFPPSVEPTSQDIRECWASRRGRNNSPKA